MLTLVLLPRVHPKDPPSKIGPCCHSRSSAGIGGDVYDLGFAAGNVRLVVSMVGREIMEAIADHAQSPIPRFAEL